MIISLVAALFVFAGSAFFAVAGLGVVRLPDVFCRMHAVSKASSLGMGLILFGAALQFGTAAVILKCAFTLVFIFLTTPVAAHLLGRAALMRVDAGKASVQEGSRQTASPVVR
jgi:multicomponent Na+:H+ antiporter subunit G